MICLLAGCQKKDTGKPVITLKGTNPDIVIWGSSATYPDPGAVVVDDFDGAIGYTLEGTVNMYSAGEYILKYIATDGSNNISTVNRSVIVDAAPYLSGDFMVSNYISGVLDSIYSDSILVTPTTNRIEFKSFAAKQDAKIYCTVSGNTITLPQQTLKCGNPARNITFSGSGNFVIDTAFSINYTLQDSTLLYTGRGDYKRK